MADVRGTDLLADHTLASNARRGVRSSFDGLFDRHALAAWRLAIVVTRDSVDAELAVANGFATALTRAPARTLGMSADSFRVELLRATRRAAVDLVSQRSPGAARSALPLSDGAAPRTAVIQRAFDELPERWRSILWLVEVDGLSLDDAAQVIHVAPTAAASLLERSHRGFQEQVLLGGLTSATPTACRRTSDRLTDYRAGALGDADHAQVRSHLDGCAACRDRLASLDDLIAVLRLAGQPLPGGLADLAAARWAAALVVDAGPLHLVLPGGQPMPAWAQRAFAGVVAGVVALGITGATMIAGRGRGAGREVIARPQVAAGESALGGAARSDVELDGRGIDLPTSPPTSASSASPALPRTAGPGTPATDVVPAPAIAPGGGNVQAPAGGASDGDSPSASQGVAMVIDGVGGVTIGPDCQGGELFGSGFGDCALPDATGPVTVAVPLAAPASPFRVLR